MTSPNFVIVVVFVAIWMAVVLFFVGVALGSVLRSLRITRRRAEEIKASANQLFQRRRR